MEPFFITNIVYYVYPTGFPLGQGQLPEFIKKSRSNIGLEKNAQRQYYNDNLCAFRCLALALQSKNLWRMQ